MKMTTTHSAISVIGPNNTLYLVLNIWPVAPFASLPDLLCKLKSTMLVNFILKSPHLMVAWGRWHTDNDRQSVLAEKEEIDGSKLSPYIFCQL
jgi:hypothetical protein